MTPKAYKLADGRTIIRNRWVSFGRPFFHWIFYDGPCKPRRFIELLPVDVEPDEIILEGEHVTTRTYRL